MSENELEGSFGTFAKAHNILNTHIESNNTHTFHRSHIIYTDSAAPTFMKEIKARTSTTKLIRGLFPRLVDSAGSYSDSTLQKLTNTHTQSYTKTLAQVNFLRNVIYTDSNASTFMKEIKARTSTTKLSRGLFPRLVDLPGADSSQLVAQDC